MVLYWVLKQPSEIGSSYVYFIAEDPEFEEVTFSWYVAAMGFRWTGQALGHTDLSSFLVMSLACCVLSSKISELVFPHISKRDIRIFGRKRSLVCSCIPQIYVGVYED